MATRLDVQLDKSGVDQGLKQTAKEVRDVGKAAKEVDQEAGRAGDELREMGAVGKAGAGEAEQAVESLGRELDDVSKKADDASSSVGGLGASLGPLAAGATAAVVGFKLLFDAAVSAREMIREMGENGSEEMRLLTEEIDNLVSVFQGASFSAVDGLTQSLRDAAAAATGTNGSLVELIDLIIPSNFQAGYELATSMREASDAAADATENVSSLKDEAAAALEAFHNRELSDQIRQEAQKVETIRDANTLINEQIELLKEASETGELSTEGVEEAEKRLRALFDRRKQLKREQEREEERAIKEAEQEEERLANEAHRNELARIEEQKRERQRADREAARERDRIRREEERAEQQRQRDREQAAQELLNDNEGLAGVLAGEGQSLEDVASAVAQNRGQAAGAAFDERMKSGQYDDKGLSQRDLRRMRQREVRRAEAGGFRDTRAGRASEDELMQAQQQNARETVNALAESGQVSQGMIEALAEATRQVQQYEQEQARNQADIEQLKQALGRSGRAAQRRRDQSNSFKQ